MRRSPSAPPSATAGLHIRAAIGEVAAGDPDVAEALDAYVTMAAEAMQNRAERTPSGYTLDDAEHPISVHGDAGDVGARRRRPGGDEHLSADRPRAPAGRGRSR